MQSWQDWRDQPSYFHIKNCERAYHKMTEILDVDPLLPQLYTDNCISKNQREDIDLTTTRLRKAQKLMDIVLMQDIVFFGKFMIILHDIQRESFDCMLSFL